VQDNGKGFDTSSTASGNGLSNIKNRVSLMGAAIDIFSNEKSGTEITIELNIKEKND
jgi:signal transduction histidine kinase